MENSIKFDHIQNYPGRTGANIMLFIDPKLPFFSTIESFFLSQK